MLVSQLMCYKEESRVMHNFNLLRRAVLKANSHKLKLWITLKVFHLHDNRYFAHFLQSQSGCILTAYYVIII